MSRWAIILSVLACACGARTALEAEGADEPVLPTAPQCRPGDSPVVLPLPAEVLGPIRQHGEHVYAIDVVGHTIYRRPKDERGAPTSLISSEQWRAAYEAGSGDVDCCLALAVDDARVYFTAFPRSFTIPLEGGVPSILTDVVDPKDIAIDAEHVYLAFGDLLRVPLGGGPTEHLAALEEDAYGLAVDGSYVYFTFANSPRGRVLRSPKDGGAVEVLADHQVRPRAVRVDRDSVFWVDQGDDQGMQFGVGSGVYMAPKVGGAVRALATDQGVLESLAVDDDSVYWIDALRGRVMKAPKAGGAPVALAPVSLTFGYDAYIDVDDACVYWTDRDLDRVFVMRAPK